MSQVAEECFGLLYKTYLKTLKAKSFRIGKVLSENSEAD